MQDPFVNIAPKKPNWDLRRDVQKRLEKLEKRTQIALRQLMRKFFIYSFVICESNSARQVSLNFFKPWNSIIVSAVEQEKEREASEAGSGVTEDWSTELL